MTSSSSQAGRAGRRVLLSRRPAAFGRRPRPARRRRAAVGPAHLDRAELDEVARERGLGDREALAPASSVGELGLRADRAAGAGARRSAGAGPSWSPGAVRRRRWSTARPVTTAPAATRAAPSGRAAGSRPRPRRGRRAVDDRRRDLLAAVRGQAVQHDRAVGAARASAASSTAYGTNGRARVVRLVLLAHRDPGVGGEDVGAVGGRRGVGGDGDRAARARRRAAGRRRRRRVGQVAGGRADPHVHPGVGAAEQVGVRHVVGAVAQVGQREAGQAPAPLADGLQVGEDLARVERVGERVDDGHAGSRPPSPRCGPGRRCATRSRRPGGPSTRAVSSIGSPRPIWLRRRRSRAGSRPARRRRR